MLIVCMTVTLVLYVHVCVSFGVKRAKDIFTTCTVHSYRTLNHFYGRRPFENCPIYNHGQYEREHCNYSQVAIMP